FPTGNHHVPRIPLLHLGNNFIGRHITAFRLPRRIRRIAEPTPQIATARAHEHTRHACEHAFPLHRPINLSNPHLVLLCVSDGSHHEPAFPSDRRTTSAHRRLSGCTSPVLDLNL